LLRSLKENNLGPEGGKAIAEALKVNMSVQNIKSAQNLIFLTFHIPETYSSGGPLVLTYFVLWLLSFCSLYDNKLGPEGGTAIAEALQVNTSVQNIK
jgi:hypothetical protein